MRHTMIFLFLVLGCGGGATAGDASAPGDSNSAAPDLLGTWQTNVGMVAISVSFSGSATTGTVQTVQSSPVGGDLPSCRGDVVGNGTFVVSGGAVTLDTPAGVQRTHGCMAADTESPLTDATPLRNFAGALSGPFVLTETTLMLGTSYPQLNRVTR